MGKNRLWQYTDGQGNTVVGTIKRVVDLGGTDITYIMESIDGVITVLSGSRLKTAKPIYKERLK